MTTGVSSVGSVRAGLCPHGLPPGACPICSGMGGSSQKVQTADFSAKPGEMSWNECAAIGAFLKSLKNARMAREADFQRHILSMAKFEADMTKAAQQLNQFIEAGGWKARKNGRDINISIGYREIRNKDNSISILVDNPRTNWREWIKTIGILVNDTSPYSISYKGEIIEFSLDEKNNGISVLVKSTTCKEKPEFVKMLKYEFPICFLSLNSFASILIT